MPEQSKFPDVQGGPPAFFYYPGEAYNYIINILGRKEGIPQRFSVKAGIQEILMCLKVRYGKDKMDEFILLIDIHLAKREDDEEIWGEWRVEYAELKKNHRRDVELPPLEERVFSWDDGNPQLQPLATSASIHGTPWKPQGVREILGKVKEAGGRLWIKVRGNKME